MANKEVRALRGRHAELVLQQHNLKEHISLAWKQLRTRGLHGHDLQLLEIMPSQVPRCGIGERARAVFFRDATRPVAVGVGTH